MKRVTDGKKKPNGTKSAISWISIDGMLGGKERERLADRELSRQVLAEWSSAIVDGR